MNIVNQVAKRLAGEHSQFINKFYKVHHTPYLVDTFGKLSKIYRRGNAGTVLDSYRIAYQYQTNYWIPVDYIQSIGGSLIEQDATIVVDLQTSVMIEGVVYKRSVEVTNIENVNNVVFDDKLFKTKNYNRDQRNADLDQRIDKLGICILEGVTNEPQVAGEVDAIAIPSFNQFISAGEYYETLFHELAHYVRFNKMGIDQNLIADWNVYYKEELIAELAASMIAKYFKINFDQENTINYLDYFVRALAESYEITNIQAFKYLKQYSKHACETAELIIKLIK